MRKWMRERLKRRKKDPAKIEEKAAPLQPAYFEAEAATPAASPDQPEAVPHQTAREQIQTEEPRTQEPSTPSKGADPRRRRRRRGRGGRGRDGRSSQTTSASPPAQILHSEAMPPAREAEPLPAKAPIPVVTHAAKLQPPKGVVVLAIGLPGSGKSSWFKRHSIAPLSSDMLRSLLFDDPTEQRYQDLIFSNLRSMLKARLIARRPLSYVEKARLIARRPLSYVDATNLTPHERHSWIKLAKDYGYDVHAVFFDVPLEVCLERNRRRQRVVTEDVMRRMAAKLRQPAFDEGFTKITVVRVKQSA